MKRGLVIAAGILVAAICVGAVWYQADQGHRLMHAALAGRDEPIRLALSKAPSDAGLWELLGEAYANQSRYADAIQAYDRSIALAPHDETTWWMKGIAEVCRENPEGVGSVAVRLDALDPSSGRAAPRSEAPSNNEMQRTSHGPDGGSPLISVLDGRLPSV
jgi:tetratricopeptide (TPR) repeat protein